VTFSVVFIAGLAFRVYEPVLARPSRCSRAGWPSAVAVLPVGVHGIGGGTVTLLSKPFSANVCLTAMLDAGAWQSMPTVMRFLYLLQQVRTCARKGYVLGCVLRTVRAGLASER
jgi:hypothetical protein